VSNLVLWAATLGLGLLLVGALRVLRAWTWRLEQREVALSGRLGLPPGTRAPAFRLRDVQGAAVALKGFAGRFLLVTAT
jgi:hypothetical protein